jgi:hypothetical protein
MRSYRYTTTDGQPLRRCPECAADLTLPDTVELEFYIHNLGEVSTCLQDDGTLVDVGDFVANGYHSGTYCNRCSELLINHPDVQEHEDGGPCQSDAV